MKFYKPAVEPIGLGFRKRKTLINYANDRFATRQERNSISGLRVGGFDEALSFGPDDIDPEFYRRNQSILIAPRGNGYWLWKPYFIYKVLSTVEDGDFVIYTDSGCYFIASVDPLIDLASKSHKGLLLFTLHPDHTNGKWTKRDCFHFMGLDDKFRYDLQILGSFVCILKSDFAMSFVKRWLDFAMNANAVNDDPNICLKPNYPEFVEHRHDQSILSLLGRQHGIETIPDISQWGNGEDRRGIGQIIDHTR